MSVCVCKLFVSLSFNLYPFRYVYTSVHTSVLSFRCVSMRLGLYSSVCLIISVCVYAYMIVFCVCLDAVSVFVYVSMSFFVGLSYHFLCLSMCV